MVGPSLLDVCGMMCLVGPAVVGCLEGVLHCLDNENYRGASFIEVKPEGVVQHFG